VQFVQFSTAGLVELNGGRFSFSLCTMQQQIECWKLGII
jgi:hypothetical protein